jgi:hypothetical protein
MSARVTPWRRTGHLCKRGKPIEQRRSEYYVLQQSDPYDVEVESRCCRECEAEGE